MGVDDTRRQNSPEPLVCVAYPVSDRSHRMYDRWWKMEHEWKRGWAGRIFISAQRPAACGDVSSVCSGGNINFYSDSTSNLPSPGARRKQNQRHSQSNVYSRMPPNCNTVESRSFSRFGRRCNSSATVSAFARGGTPFGIHVHDHFRQRLHPFVAILSQRHPRGLHNRIGSLFALHIRPHGVHTHSV